MRPMTFVPVSKAPAPKAAPPPRMLSGSNQRGGPATVAPPVTRAAPAPPPRMLSGSNQRGGPATVAPPVHAPSRASAEQAFHHEEAQSHVPAVTAHNDALAKQATAAYERHQLALQLMVHAHNLAQIDPHNLAPALYKQYEAAHPSGGGLLGAIESPVHVSAAALGGLASGAGHVLSHLGSDIVHLPESAIQGLWELGKAPFKDALSASMNLSQGASAANALPKSQTVDLLQGMAKSDPLFQLATLHPGQAGKLAYAHPLNAITDVLGAAGIAGRAAGAASRAAGVAEDLSPLARAAKELPGGLSPVERRYSPNLFVAKAQQALDRHGNPVSRALPNTVHIGHTDFPLSGFDREMYRRANEHQLVAESMAQKAAAYRRANPITGPGAQPLVRQVATERRLASSRALMDTIRQNALTNPRTGDIFYAGKGTPRLYRTDIGPGKMTRAMQKLADDQGVQFVRRQLPRSITGSNRSVSVVIPKTLHDTLSAHRAISTEHVTLPGKVWRFGTQRFRRTVLPFSAKWITGNVTEATGRSALRGVSPTHQILGRDLVNAMRDNGHGFEADRLEAQALQGTHFSFQKREAAKYASDHPHAAVRGLGRAAHYAGKPANASFAFNQRLEQSFAHGVLGKHASAYAKLIKDQFPGLTKEQRMELLAKIYTKPEVARDAGRFGRDVLGQYAAFGPGVGKFIHNYAPFAPWYANATKFMGTLPLRHPVTTAALLDAARATDKQWKKEHQAISGLGGDLTSFPMTGKEQALDIGRYLPMGAFSGGVGLSPANAAFADAGQTILPQVSDAFKAFVGLDPFGRQLAFPGPTPGKILKSGKPSQATVHIDTTPGQPHALNAISDILASMLGPTQQIRRVLGERGGTPYSGTDVIWDPTPPIKGGAAPFDLKGVIAGLNKVFNPVHPVDLTARRKKAASHSRPSRGFGGGGRGFGGGSSGFGSGRSGF